MGILNKLKEFYREPVPAEPIADQAVIDKTYDEINEAFLAGKRIWAISWRRYIAPSYTIYGDKSIQEMFIDWYEPMLDEDREDKYIIYHQITLDKIQGTDHITSHDYEVSATMRSNL